MKKKYDGTKFSTNTITNNDNVDDQQQYSNTSSDICLTKHPDNDNNINVSNVNTINNDNKITIQSERYATTRYPFAPFIVRFHVTNINEQKVVEELIDFIKQNMNEVVEFAGYRRSTAKCCSNESDLLLFVKDSNSFCILYNDANWPRMLSNSNYTIVIKPSIPAQLSLLITNVDLRLDFNDFTNDLKEKYPAIKNVVRMKNKFQKDIRVVKIELTSTKDRNELIDVGKVVANAICYNVVEYLAPAMVLICSKCLGLGHFRRNCKEDNDTCKVCGEPSGPNKTDDKSPEMARTDTDVIKISDPLSPPLLTDDPVNSPGTSSLSNKSLAVLSVSPCRVFGTTANGSSICYDSSSIDLDLDLMMIDNDK
ncbi:unnamed protein product [Rotaria sp. Silwood2]|nr:unnamed protein product [Rotaria sp. Silwood2]